MQTFLSSQLLTAPAQTVLLPLHTSVTVQAFLSSQTVSFAAGLAAHLPSLAQYSAVHALPSSLQSLFLAQKLPQPTIGLNTHCPVFTSQLSAVQILASLHNLVTSGVHLPLTHVSPLVQASPSLHAPTNRLTCKQFPDVGSQPSVVQTLLSLQSFTAPDSQAPFLQTSTKVQGFPSEQASPLATGKSTHFLLAALQLADVQVLPLGGQSRSTAQLPAQPMIGVNTQLPVFTSQLSFVHATLSLQALGVPALQTLPAQVSACVHALPSLQAMPLFGVVMQAPVFASQASLVHKLPSLQTLKLAPVHTPCWQLLSPLQPFLSSQRVLFALACVVHFPAALSHTAFKHTLATAGQSLSAAQKPPQPLMGLAAHTPLEALQLSLVQALLSSHTLAGPGMHVPATHKSPWVHGVPSVQAPALFTLTHLPVLWLQLSSVHKLLSLQTIKLVP